jgi:hypothetical protein
VYLPTPNGTFGYDLVAGDLVSPHGTGRVADFIFHASTATDKTDFDVDITFSNPQDGLQPFFVQRRKAITSELRSSHTAPTDGYFASLSEADDEWKQKYKALRESERVWAEEVNYYFRVRSGTTGNPLYGKVYGFFRSLIIGDGTPALWFTYFVNPDGTRNLELDPKQNLMKAFRRNESQVPGP